MSLARGAVVAALALAATPALAHDVVLGVGGFTGGLLHPLLVPAHLLALTGLALFLGQQPRVTSAGLLAVFTASLIVGVIAIVSAVSPVFQGEVVLGVAAVAGLLVALARPITMLLSLPLIVIAGIAIMLDSVPDDMSMQRTFLALVGTVLAAVVVIVLIAEIGRALRRDWQRIGVRIVGSWIAASAILVLALRLAR
jgi:hydrogenase/urease accessory protein HupE